MAAALLSLALTGFTAEPTLVQYSLPELLERASTAFSAGDFAAAADSFAAVERDYGSEEAWQNGNLPRRILPLQGFAELKSGQPQAAAGTLAAFLSQFPDDPDQTASVRYALAIALQMSGKEDEALEAFQDYRESHPDDRQLILARFQEAELLLRLNRVDEGLSSLDQIRRSEAADSLKLQARLLAVQRAIGAGLTEEAVRRLLAEPWDAGEMPEIAVLAFAGLDLGDRLMAEDRPQEAIRAYQLVPPRSVLIDLQQDRLGELRERIRQRSALVQGSAASFWVQFYADLVDRIERQLSALQQSEDYTPSLSLRRAQAFLLAGRPREAWLLCESLATNDSIDAVLREEAHFRWILSASALERWEDALAIGRSFADRYPDSPRTPGAFYSMAQAHLEQRRLVEAAQVLSELIERFPRDNLHGRALFLRGYVRTLQERFQAARLDFDLCRTLRPGDALAVNAGLWHALTWFFEREYQEALTELESLLSGNKEHVLYPEIQYRIATTSYALRDFERAQTELEFFLENYPGHAREAEALVLLGDTLMGAGELDRALAAFKQVPPEAVTQETYAVFQIGKILKAREQFAEMSTHFQTYANREVQPPRISEALYWVGWAEDRQGHPQLAEPVFREALQRFGDDPQSTEIIPMIEGLARLSRRTDPDESGFIDWVESEREIARQDSAFCFYARLSLYLADRHLAVGRPWAAESLVLEIARDAPLETLGPLALGRVGLVLQEIGAPSAQDYFDRLLVAFPDSYQRAYAWLGLGRIAFEAGDDQTAVEWLDRCGAETPGHAVAARALLTASEARLNLGRIAEATEGFNQVLSMKSARGILRAEALRGLAETALADGDPARAIACFQRIYTLYQAYDELVAEAYFRSAGLFEEAGDPRAAYRSYRELAGTERLRETGYYQAAIEARDRLAAEIETREEPAS